jgi:hypothetical protein
VDFPNGKLIKGMHPALIDLETFLKANDVMQRMPTAGKPKQYRHAKVPLKVFTRDEMSGMPLTGYSTKNNWCKLPLSSAIKIRVNDKSVC